MGLIVEGSEAQKIKECCYKTIEKHDYEKSVKEREVKRIKTQIYILVNACLSGFEPHRLVPTLPCFV